MNAQTMATVLRAHADKIQAIEALGDANRLDTAELVRVLARVVEGKPIHRAFGAPGDWGYSNPIGQALAATPEAS